MVEDEGPTRRCLRERCGCPGFVELSVAEGSAEDVAGTVSTSAKSRFRRMLEEGDGAQLDETAVEPGIAVTVLEMGM